jgi:hypothetical protein
MNNANPPEDTFTTTVEGAAAFEEWRSERFDLVEDLGLCMGELYESREEQGCGEGCDE